MLQEGIYHAPGMRPGRFFAILFLQASSEAPAGGTLAALWSMYKGLKAGRVPDLDAVVVPHEDDAMTVLLGVGPNVWDLPGVTAPRPRGFSDDNLFRSPQGRGGPLLVGSGLRYAPDVVANPATEHVCVQVIADTKLAVDRAVVESWKVMADAVDVDTGVAPLSLVGFYLGFQRSDRRSWIDFHDGLSNLPSGERERVVVAKAGADEPWCVGGTYLAFLRLAVDLPAWRRLGRRDQELMVGRNKLTGCPLVAIGDDGTLSADPACPVAGTQIWQTANDLRYAEPPATVADPALRASHVHRANHHQTVLEDPGSRRIFRQGYEFLEWQESAPGFRLGLNFVSFQDTPARLVRMLDTQGWLGRVNFGGDPAAQPDGMAALLSVYAAGIYFVPPHVEGEAFPGATALGLGG
jgi:Dyp-type peroxidase family